MLEITFQKEELCPTDIDWRDRAKRLITGLINALHALTDAPIPNLWFEYPHTLNEQDDGAVRIWFSSNDDQQFMSLYETLARAPGVTNVEPFDTANVDICAMNPEGLGAFNPLHKELCFSK